MGSARHIIVVKRRGNPGLLLAGVLGCFFGVLGIVPLAALSAVESAQGEQDAPVTDCDTYAASPFDPAHKTGGVPSEKLNPDLAVPACENAVRRYPNSNRLIFQLGRAYDKNNNYAEALKWYRKAADRGLAIGQYNLGVMLRDGHALSQNYAEAVKWFRKAADQGNALAQNDLGAMYANGQGAAQSFSEAAKWFRRAADQGNAMAQASLGLLYDIGQGVARDYAQAAAWYRKAADQGVANAQANLGILYANGRGVRRDVGEAAKWYRKGAEQGDPTAQHNLGVMYSSGQGLPLNYTEAVKWIRRAADQGTPEAQAALGEMYANGQGVAKGLTEAEKWWRKAADQGNAIAQNNLSSLSAGARSPAAPAQLTLSWDPPPPIGSAAAAGWKTIEADNGTIFRVNLAELKQIKKISSFGVVIMRVWMDTTPVAFPVNWKTLAFNCQGFFYQDLSGSHPSMFDTPWQPVPPSSAVAQIRALACDGAAKQRG
jgi:TPR repeat protein